ELASRGPERVEPLVVDSHQRAVLIAHVQAERLPDLEALGAAGHLLAEARGGPLAKAIAMLWPGAPVNPPEHAEALWSGGFEALQPLIQDILAPAAVEVDIHAHVGLVERVEQLGGRPLAPATAEVRAKVVVGVDDREARPLDRRRRHAQLGLWAELVKVEIAIHL